MSKAVLVMDMPGSCRDCFLFEGDYANMCCRALNNRTIDYPYPKDFRQDWCPLKEVPEKLGLLDRLQRYDTDLHYEIGWNNCVDTILE